MGFTQNIDESAGAPQILHKLPKHKHHREMQKFYFRNRDKTTLQLDIDMIKNIIREQKSCIMAKSIVAIACTFNIEVIVEWVYNEETFDPAIALDI
jgi:glutamate 5-kinase